MTRPENERDPALLNIAAEHPELVDYLDGLQRRIEALESKDGGWRASS